jgi:hypothetical protein
VPNADDPHAHPEPAQARQAQPLPEVPAHLARDLAAYVLIRLALVSLIAAGLIALGAFWPVAVAVGVIMTLPLSALLMRGWRDRLARGLAARGMVRRAARDRLRAELRGEIPGDAAG